MPTDPRLYMQVYAALHEQIRDGRLPSGTRLNIDLIAQQHEVSRPTVAHALRMLEAEKLVVRYPGLGWFVAGGE